MRKGKRPAVAWNQTQVTWLVLPVLCHWDMTTRLPDHETGQPPALTVLYLYMYKLVLHTSSMLWISLIPSWTKFFVCSLRLCQKKKKKVWALPLKNAGASWHTVVRNCQLLVVTFVQFFQESFFTSSFMKTDGLPNIQNVSKRAP